MDIIRDPIWQFIGAVIAFIGILVTFLIFYRQKTRKQLSYKIITNAPLVRLSKELKPKLKIYYKENLTQSINLLIIKFINSGNTSILPSEFERPIKISVGSNSEILEADIFKVVPDTIQPQIVTSLKNLELMPLLLNSGDQIYLQLLIKEFEKDPEVDGRIAGINQIFGKSTFPISKGLLLFDIVLFSIGAFSSPTAIIFGSPLWFNTSELGGILMILLGLLSLYATIWGIFDLYRDIRKIFE